MTIEYWICPAPLLLQPCDTMRPFDAPCGPEQCHVETEWMISVAKYIFYRIKKIFWQCSDIIVRIVRFHREWPDCQHRGSQWPHTITETIRFLLTMRKHSSIYFSPTVLHTLTVPPEYARLNLDSAEKSKQDQLSGTVQLKVPVHHRRRRSRFSRLMSGFCTATRLKSAWSWSPPWTVRLETGSRRCVCNKLLCPANSCKRVFRIFLCSRCADLKQFWVHHVLDNNANSK